MSGSSGSVPSITRRSTLANRGLTASPNRHCPGGSDPITAYDGSNPTPHRSAGGPGAARRLAPGLASAPTERRHRGLRGHGKQIDPVMANGRALVITPEGRKAVYLHELTRI
jgi:hypothetical protein